MDLNSRRVCKKKNRCRTKAATETSPQKLRKRARLLAAAYWAAVDWAAVVAGRRSAAIVIAAFLFVEVMRLICAVSVVVILLYTFAIIFTVVFRLIAAILLGVVFWLVLAICLLIVLWYHAAAFFLARNLNFLALASVVVSWSVIDIRSITNGWIAIGGFWRAAISSWLTVATIIDWLITTAVITLTIVLVSKYVLSHE